RGRSETLRRGLGKRLDHRGSLTLLGTVRRDADRHTHRHRDRLVVGIVADRLHHVLDQEVCGPHTLRHAFITAAPDAGVPLRDVQEAASHADPRTTMRYDRARVSLDRHATYIVATFLAGAARLQTSMPPLGSA